MCSAYCLVWLKGQYSVLLDINYVFRGTIFIFFFGAGKGEEGYGKEIFYIV